MAAYERAMDMIAEGRHAAALPLLDEAVHAEPERARIHSNRAFVLHRLERFQDARLAAARGVELRGRDAYPLLMAARILLDQGSLSAAVVHAQAAWDEREGLAAEHAAEAAEIAAYGLNERGEWRVALPLIDEALELAPACASLYGVRATCLAHGQRWGEARRALDEGLRLAPDDEDLADRAETIDKGVARLAEMLAGAQAALRESESWERWHELATLLFMSGDTEAAKKAFDRARKLHPEPRYRRRRSTSMLSHWEADCRLALLQTARR